MMDLGIKIKATLTERQLMKLIKNKNNTKSSLFKTKMKTYFIIIYIVVVVENNVKQLKIVILVVKSKKRKSKKQSKYYLKWVLF